MKIKIAVLTILGSASLLALAQMQPGGNPPVGASGNPPVGAPGNPPVGAPGNPPGVVPGNGNNHITPPNNGANNDAKDWHGSGNFNNGNNGAWHGSGEINTNNPWHGSGDFNNNGNHGSLTNH